MRPYEVMQRRKIISHNGNHWRIDAKATYRPDGTGELRVYRVEGDVTTADLADALELEAAACGLSMHRQGQKASPRPSVKPARYSIPEPPR